MTQELDALRLEISQLKESEAYYRSIFEHAPIALVEEDCSEVKQFIDGLYAKGIQDIRDYFQQNPDDLVTCLNTLDSRFMVNNALLALYKAKSQTQLLESMYTVVQTENSYEVFRELFVAFASGKNRFVATMDDNAIDGTPLHLFATWTIVPGYEANWGRVVVFTIPIQQMTEVLASIKG